MAQRVLILGAAGRDFHNFNVYFRNNPDYKVVAFTATQIPNIAGRRYPPELAGEGYPDGIPIEREEELERLVAAEQVDEVVFSYSDVPYTHVMRVAARAMAAGADFRLLGPRRTMLAADKPVIAVCAARTGAGKSQTSRHVLRTLRELGQTAVVVRHPMPYGDLARQAVQRFASLDDLDQAQVTVEEREDYEPHLLAGSVVYAGVDYAAILQAAQAEADIVVWDGGNNDLPFFAPDLHITVVDPQRAGHMHSYYPGEINVRMADVIVVNKMDTGSWEQIEETYRLVWQLNPQATLVTAASPILVTASEQAGNANNRTASEQAGNANNRTASEQAGERDPASEQAGQHNPASERIRGQRVLVVEDGPTVTHGELAYGAGWLAARRYGAAEIVDPRPHAVGSLAETYAAYPHMGPILPAMGYGDQQRADLAETIRNTPADLVLVATPVDLGRILDITQPVVRVTYALQEIGLPTLHEILSNFVSSVPSARGAQTVEE